MPSKFAKTKIYIKADTGDGKLKNNHFHLGIDVNYIKRKTKEISNRLYLKLGIHTQFRR